LAVTMVPIGYWLLVPLMRPFRWSRLLWAYVLPVIPFVLWFDGVMSCLRAYSPAEMKELTVGLAGESYHWEAGEKHGGGTIPKTITYLIGWPAARASSATREAARLEVSA